MRLSEIDESNREDHFHLDIDDQCFYLIEYTSDRGYSFSKANNAISNLKKKPSRRGYPEYRYKLKAMRQATSALRRTLNPEWLNITTLVPVPGSKARDHLEYDDRMEVICRGIGDQVDVRNLVHQRESTLASHEAVGNRITLEELLDLYEIDELKTEPAPRSLGVVDDVLTAGTHYRAMKSILADRFPGVPIVGIFIARRVFPQD